MKRFITLFSFSIPVYGLFMSIAFVLCSLLIIRRSKYEKVLYEDIIIVIATALGFSIIGGGFLYNFVTYGFKVMIDLLFQVKFSEFFNGGIVFYGGLAGGILGGILASKLLKLDINIVEKIIIPYIPLAHGIGRIGCVFAGCCYGFEYSGIFAIYNFYSSPPGLHFPIQIIEIIFNLFNMNILLFLSKKNRNNYELLRRYLYLYSVERFVIEFFRGDTIRGGFMYLSTSQWISIVILFICFAFEIKEINLHKEV